jgi:hypothetical protein
MESNIVELNFPIIRNSRRCKQVLSMDQYEEFNLEDLSQCFDRDAYLREKKKREVNVPFYLVETNGK